MTEDQGRYGLKIENVSPSLLKPNPWNPNIVSPQNETKLEESVKRNGVFKPILVRELKDGSLEIIGGEHRVLAAKKLKFEKIPIINLGKLSDEKAKELCILDNGRYGEDDTLALSELLRELGTPDDILSFLPYSSDELDSIFNSSSIELDDLDSSTEDIDLDSLPSKTAQVSQLMRFKVPIEDSEFVQRLVDTAMKSQGFTGEDSLSNAGHALVYLLKKK